MADNWHDQGKEAGILNNKTDYKIIAFDVDGTLVKEKSSWLTMHEYFKRQNLAREHLRLYEDGDIDYVTFMRWDIALWPKPLHIDEVNKILSQYTLEINARYVIQELKNKGYNVILISAGIDILTKKVAGELDINMFLANGLEVYKDGYLTGNGIFRVDLLDKHLALKNMLDKFQCSRESCIAVGDSKYDTTMLTYVGCGIALGNDERLRNSARYTINNLSDLLHIV